jgi:hypothetical protein
MEMDRKVAFVTGGGSLTEWSATFEVNTIPADVRVTSSGATRVTSTGARRIVEI